MLKAKRKKGYYCPKCDKYLTIDRVWAEDKMVSDVYCKKCNTVVRFLRDSEIPVDEGFLYKLGKMVAL